MMVVKVVNVQVGPCTSSTLLAVGDDSEIGGCGDGVSWSEVSHPRRSGGRDMEGGATGYIGSLSYPNTMTRGMAPLDTSSSSAPQKALACLSRLLTEVYVGRKAHLLEDKQIPSVGVFDEVFSTWMAFGGNTLHGDGVAGIKRRRDLSGDGVRNLVRASGWRRTLVVSTAFKWWLRLCEKKFNPIEILSYGQELSLVLATTWVIANMMFNLVECDGVRQDCISQVGEGGESWLEDVMGELSFESSLQGDGGLGIGVGVSTSSTLDELQ
ncbi:hypothetical protein Tco_1485402 [Tanacetum coccineum]